ncbi:MAG: group II intron reverse transcriptase/maturase [Hyphomicrobiaceae bacterium]
MSLATPEKIRTLQRKLYIKAKAEPAFRFYQLYDKIYREDILRHAYRLARVNAGMPGVDGVSFAQIEEEGPEAWLAGLAEELASKTYRPEPVRRVLIPKSDGGERPLGIPTIRDRVVQTAAKLVLEPIFEADFEDNAYGYRPKRGAVDAVKRVHQHICQGYTDVVDADLSGYFDSIPHDDLLKSVARRIVDVQMLRLIKLWLKAPIEERDGNGKRRITGGKRNSHGTPQGGVISPLLANIYMNRFLKYWRVSGCDDVFRARVVAYADDFVILSRGRAEEAMTWTKAVMTKLGLTLNEAKTSLKDARAERFDFLGYTLGPHVFKANGHRYLSASPSKKSVRRLRANVRRLLSSGNHDPWHEVCVELNRVLSGWSNYFSYGTRSQMYRAVDHFAYERVRDFLARRHKVAGRGTRRFSMEVVYENLGLLRLERLPSRAPPCA